MYREAMNDLQDASIERVLVFTLSTIQATLATVPAQMEAYDRDELDSLYLWGSKRTAMEYYLNNRAEWEYGLLKYVWANDVVGAQYYVSTTMPGLGLVKASFFLQLLGMNCACLDTHNLRHLGLSAGKFKWSKGTKEVTILKKIALYNTIAQAEAGQANMSEWWWDKWCNFVAGRGGNKALATGEDVSQLHVDAIKGDY